MCYQNEPGDGHYGEHHGGHHGSCGCGHATHHTDWQASHHGHGWRRFVSREEIISRLEEYLRQLQAEAKGVEERIAELRKES